MEKLYLRPHELSARWERAVTEKTLANWRHIGDGPAYIKAGGRVLYILKSIEDYEKRRSMAGKSGNGAAHPA